MMSTTSLEALDMTISEIKNDTKNSLKEWEPGKQCQLKKDYSGYESTDTSSEPLHQQITIETGKKQIPTLEISNIFKPKLTKNKKNLYL